MYTHEQNRHFAFANQQVANSPYHLVKRFPEQQVVRQSDYDNLGHRFVDCKPLFINFDA